jgi:uncharacterized protein (TIGR00251 family)
MIELALHREGVLLSVKAEASARVNAVRGEHNGMLRVAVTAAPEKGKANRAILDVLAVAIGIRRSQISLIAGETRAQKRVLVRGLQAEELEARLAQAMGS